MANRLIPLKNYEHFLKKGIFDRDTICQFARQINRDPAIILGRLQNDGIVPYDDRVNNLGLIEPSVRHGWFFRIYPFLA